MSNTKLLYLYFDPKDFCTHIVTNQSNIKIHLNPILVLNQFCIERGSSLEGRMKSFQVLTNTKQKPAVLLDERNQLLLFPTHGITNDACVWISYHEVFSYHAQGNQTEIVFVNGEKLLLSVQYRTIKLQMERCEMFLQQLQHQSIEESTSNLLDSLKSIDQA